MTAAQTEAWFWAGGKMFALFLLRLKQGFSADRGTESLENEDLEEAVRYGVLLREQPLRKEPGRR